MQYGNRKNMAETGETEKKNDSFWEYTEEEKREKRIAFAMRFLVVISRKRT